MKKIIMGMIWIAVLWAVFAFLGGAFGGLLTAGMTKMAGMTRQQSIAARDKYIPIIRSGSLLLAVIVGIIGTERGELPFTK